MKGQYFFFFFFSSRRRHTRWTGDWSSDVCSSDLKATASRSSASIWTRPATSRRGISSRSVAGGSEERRVGKECRSRWSRHHYKENHRHGRADLGHGEGLCADPRGLLLHRDG